MENNCLAVTDDLHRFLVGILPKEYGFEFLRPIWKIPTLKYFFHMTLQYVN